MASAEQKSIDQLQKLLVQISEENRNFRNQVQEKINGFETKLDSKHVPINLEQDILKSAQQAILESIVKTLTAYDSPLIKLTKQVVENHSPELRVIINDSFETVIRNDDFKTQLIEAFSHKVARTIISNHEGLFDKVSNELKQDPVFKSKATLAISNVINECLNERKTS